MASHEANVPVTETNLNEPSASPRAIRIAESNPLWHPLSCAVSHGGASRVDGCVVKLGSGNEALDGESGRRDSPALVGRLDHWGQFTESQ
eukprot:2803602-Pyramimonas_sp.AAC.1